MLATRFIIALCPATPIYLVKCDVPANRIFSRHAATVSTETTRVKGEALVFDTFEAAMEVAKDITGWGGAQRVEEIAVEVEDTRSTIATDDDLYEIRDAATMAWTESKSRGCVYGAFGHGSSVIKAMLDLGLDCAAEHREGAESPVTIYLADHLGNTAQFDWDPMQDGFDITEATCLAEGDDACDIGETEAQHEAEPDHDCERCGGSGVRIDFFPESAVSGSTSDCECTWEPRAEDAPKAAHAVDFDPAFLDSVLGRDDLTFDQTPLTPEQAKRARATLTASLMMLVLDHLPRLASSALTEARDNT